MGRAMVLFAGSLLLISAACQQSESAQTDSETATFNRHGGAAELQAILQRFGCVMPSTGDKSDKSDKTALARDLAPCSGEVAEAINNETNPNPHFKSGTHRSQGSDTAAMIKFCTTTAGGAPETVVIDTDKMTAEQRRTLWELAGDMGLGAGGGPSGGSTGCLTTGVRPI